MKKRILFLLIVCSIPITTMLTFVNCGSNSASSALVTIDGERIDNNYNNILFTSGELVRMGDVLYYYYQPEGEKTNNGLYIISDKERKLVYHPAVFSLKDVATLSLQNSDMDLLVGEVNRVPIGFGDALYGINTIIGYDEKDEKFFDTKLFADFKGEILYYYLVDGKILFATDKYIYIHSRGSYKKLLNPKRIYQYEDYGNNPGFNGWYYSKNKIYYFSSHDKSFRSYDIETGKSKLIFDKEYISNNTTAKSVDNVNNVFWVYDDCLILKVTENVSTDDPTTDNYYKIDLNNLKTTLLVYNKYDSISSENFCNGSLFISSDTDGLRMIDVYNKKITKLSRISANDIYILDDDYVFFTGSENRLFRIHKDSKNLETIF